MSFGYTAFPRDTDSSGDHPAPSGGHILPTQGDQRSRSGVPSQPPPSSTVPPGYANPSSQGPYFQVPYHQVPYHQAPYHQVPYHQAPHHQAPSQSYYAYGSYEPDGGTYHPQPAPLPSSGIALQTVSTGGQTAGTHYHSGIQGQEAASGSGGFQSQTQALGGTDNSQRPPMQQPASGSTGIHESLVKSERAWNVHCNRNNEKLRATWRTWYREVRKNATGKDSNELKRSDEVYNLSNFLNPKFANDMTEADQAYANWKKAEQALTAYGLTSEFSPPENPRTVVKPPKLQREPADFDPLFFPYPDDGKTFLSCGWIKENAEDPEAQLE